MRVSVRKAYGIKESNNPSQADHVFGRPSKDPSVVKGRIVHQQLVHSVVACLLWIGPCGCNLILYYHIVDTLRKRDA